MSKGAWLGIALLVSLVYYLLGQPLGGGPSGETDSSGPCAGITAESAFQACMENQFDGGDFPAP
jgi:hypothetical protein